MFFLIFTTLFTVSSSQLIPLPPIDNFTSDFSVKIHQTSFLCSGVAITPRSTLTVASCVNQHNVNQLRLHFGTTRLISSEFVIIPESLIIHPHFRPEIPLESNLAILRISTSEAENLNLKPRVLGELLFDNFCSISGFGELPSEVGHMVPAMIRSTETCGHLLGGNYSCIFGVSNEIRNCGGFFGASVICDGEKLGGILVGDEFCGVNPRGYLIDIGRHHEWILRNGGVKTGGGVLIFLWFFLILRNIIFN